VSSHDKGLPVHGDFCGTHLRFVMACADRDIETALAHIPAYDLARLRKLLNTPLKGMDEQKKAG
jgi:hypothetical protein